MVTQQITGGNVMKAGILVVASMMAVAIVSAQAESVTKAIAVLSPTKDSSVSGTVTFTKVDGGVKIVADVAGLTPGQHGFHIHEFGDCSAPDATSAGGHFNPGHMQHGGPDAAVRHAGDFGNLEADASGKAHYERVDTMISLEGADSIIGHGVIVHAKADDLKTQPTGNAGARVACGAIGVTKP
jgi:Cu-Zn family superoxide dismutase